MFEEKNRDGGLSHFCGDLALSKSTPSKKDGFRWATYLRGARRTVLIQVIDWSPWLKVIPTV